MALYVARTTSQQAFIKILFIGVRGQRMSMVFPMIPGTEVNLLLIILLGFSVGMISGFVGVGGGFIMTPALILLGFPAQFAVGTSLAWVMGNSVVGTLMHKQRGNVDVKLGLVVTVSAIIGVEIGFRFLDWVKSMGLAEEVVLIISICILLAIGGYAFWESCKSVLQRRNAKKDASSDANLISAKLRQIRLRPVIYFSKSGITVSLWIVLGIGLFAGMLFGLMGGGGGLIMVPSLIYLVGLPSFIAVGTGLFQIIFSSAYGAIRHTMSGNVIIFASFIMMLSSVIGVQYGVLATRFLKGIYVKCILSFSILVASLGSILKLTGVLTENNISWLKPLEIAITFGGLGLIVIMIAGLLAFAVRFNGSRNIPKYLDIFLARNS
jgi:uncharacterized membrane protein YfcA